VTSVLKRRLQNDDHNTSLSLTLLLHCSQAWAALPDDERAEKEAFHRGQGRTAGGFMAFARTTLDLLNTLSGDAVIVSVVTCYFEFVTFF
jgi:hypothetical protein